MLRDIERGKDPQILAARQIVDAANADILLLTGIDWDLDARALHAFNDGLTRPYPFVFAPQPNSGIPTGVDIDGNGASNEARDAQGYGRFTGQAGMALLSRLPIDRDKMRDFSTLLWRDLPKTNVGQAGLSTKALAVQRLSSTGHWDVPVSLPDGTRLHLLAFAATPPLFDGPEDRNGWRNHDEAVFWLRYLDGELTQATPKAPYVLLGDFDIDPADGEGRRAALSALLADPRLQDPAPRSVGAAQAADPAHRGDPARDTAELSGPGNLRLDYVLPSTDLWVEGAGVIWPKTGVPLAKVARAASRHRLVWVDVTTP